MEGNTKRKLKKEYIPLIVSILVLIVLVLAFIIVVFYKDNNGLKLPDVPDNEALNVGVFDYDTGKYDPDNLDVVDTKKVSVKYEVISDYYKNGLFLSSPVMDYEEDEFILRSGIYSNDPFVSVINKDGKLQWFNKIATKGYESLKIVKVIKDDGNYYAFGYGLNDGKYENLIIKLNSKGNEVDRTIINKDSNNAIRMVLKNSNGFVIITDGEDNVEIYYYAKSKMYKNPFYLKESKDNKFNTYLPVVKSASIDGNIITLILTCNNPNGKTNYLMYYDMSKNSITLNEFTELTKLSSPYNYEIYEMGGSFYTVFNKKVYQFSTKGEVINNYDYNSITLKDVNGCKPEDDPSITCKDQMWVGKYNISGDTFTIQNETTSDNLVFDVFDKNLKLKYRLVHSSDAHNSDDAIYLSSAYVDNKLYEFYLFGVETPSILVSIIG